MSPHHSIVVGFTLEAKLISSKYLIQVLLEILSRSVENMAPQLLTKYITWSKAVLISPFLEPLHVHVVHMASISYWWSVFSSVV